MPRIDYGYKLANGEVCWNTEDGWDVISDIPVEQWLIRFEPEVEDEYLNIDEKFNISHTFVDYGGYASVRDLVYMGWILSGNYLRLPAELVGYD